MNTTNYIRIFRGDDSDALGYQTIVGTIKTDLDLTGCKAVFRFLGFYAEFDPIPEDKKLTIVIPAQASRGFPPGVGYASLKVLDALGKIRTFTNRIPVIVDTMTPSCGCGEFEVSFSPFPELEPLKIFVGPNADDFDQYTGFISKIIDRASAQKYGLSLLFDAMDAEKTAEGGCAASPAAVKAAYDAVIGVLTDNYYTKQETDEAIDRVAAYYITYDTAGNPFPTYTSLANATTVYSGGKVRVPTRNDYCVVLADETHQGAEYRYIYAVAEGQTTGSWQAQFPVEGVMTVDQTVTKNSTNPVSGGGVWSAIWGMATTGFASLYDWVVAQLADKASTADATLNLRGPNHDGFSAWEITWVNPYYPDPIDGVTWHDGNWYLTVNGQAEVNTAISDRNAVSIDVPAAKATRTALQGYRLGPNDPSNPNCGKPLASEAEAEALRDGVAEANAQTEVIESKPNNPHLLADAFPITFTLEDTDYTVSDGDSRLSFGGSSEFTMFVDGYGICDFKSDNTFDDAWQQAENLKFNGRDPVEGVWPVLHFAVSDVKVRDVSVLMKSAVVAPSTSSADSGKAAGAKETGDALALKADDNAVVKLTGDQTILGLKSFYSGITIENGADIDFVAGGRVIIRTTSGAMAIFNNDGIDYSTDGGLNYVHFDWPSASGTLALTADLLTKLDASSASDTFSSDSSVSYPVGSHCTYNGKLYKCTTATTGGTWDASKWTEDTMTDPDAVLDITAQNQLRVVAKDGTLLWAQGYDLASTSSATLACDATNNFTFADGATTQAFTLPTAPTGKVGDFGLDIDNSANKRAATISFTNITNNTASVVIPKGENLNDMLAIAAGELARFYITLSTFRVNNLPTWHIVKQVVENGGAQS